MTQRCAELDAKLTDTERRCKQAVDSQLTLKEELTQTQLDARSKAAQAEERLLYEKQKAKVGRLREYTNTLILLFTEFTSVFLS